MLSQIENIFLKSEKKVKVQLIVLPILCIYFYFYFFTNKEVVLNNNNLMNINSLLTKKFNGSYLDLVKDIETFCLSKKIKIYSIDYNKNKLVLSAQSSLVKINDLITKIEHINSFSKIKSLSIQETLNKGKYLFQITTEFKKYYIKEKIAISEVKNKKKSIDKFKLKAIISDYILLNKKWYKLNDEVGKYKIVKIEKNLVVLSYKEKNIDLRLIKNE